MARYVEPTPEQETAWKEWLATRPTVVQELGARLEPWSLYRMKTTGHRVTIASFSEDNSVRVNITGEFNEVAFDRGVFGIDPDDLEPCDLPGSDEPTGSALTGKEVDDNIDALRVMVRPDLWEMGPDGKATRKV